MSVFESVVVSVAVSMSVILLQGVAVGAVTVTVTVSVIVSVSVIVTGVRAGGVLLKLNVTTFVSTVSVSVVLNLVVSVQLLAVDMGLESLVLVGGVVDSPLVAIGVDQLIVSGNLMAVSWFALRLDIPGLVILDAVVEVVFGVRVVVVVSVLVTVMTVVVFLVVIVVGCQVYGGVAGGTSMAVVFVAMERSCPNGSDCHQSEYYEKLRKEKDFVRIVSFFTAS